jgi:hypothetical protein
MEQSTESVYAVLISACRWTQRDGTAMQLGGIGKMAQTLANEMASEQGATFRGGQTLQHAGRDAADVYLSGSGHRFEGGNIVFSTRVIHEGNGFVLLTCMYLLRVRLNAIIFAIVPGGNQCKTPDLVSLCHYSFP